MPLSLATFPGSVSILQSSCRARRGPLSDTPQKKMGRRIHTNDARAEIEEEAVVVGDCEARVHTPTGAPQAVVVEDFSGGLGIQEGRDSTVAAVTTVAVVASGSSCSRGAEHPMSTPLYDRAPAGDRAAGQMSPALARVCTYLAIVLCFRE